ncbi:MAG: hypothetical protein LPJ97_14480, partial [Marinobacter sp.]|nr:hypothetical protein [Marinobacter sp.]
TVSQKNDLRFGSGTDAERDARGEQRLAFLRGDRSREGSDFRVRDSRLGDIIHSTPVRVSRPAVGWPDTSPFGVDTNRYSDFRAAKSSRTPVLYVGANDGMLHGFVATESGGQEVMAYMPSLVFSDQPARGMHHLTSKSYSHRYYVDLTPTVSDVYTRGRLPSGVATTARNWRTVLLGGLRSGGAGVFALDVTDPAAFSDENASQVALWEFTHPKLGVVTQPPQVALADWGNGDYRWTAFVSNGYNGQTASTGFFMLDIEGLIGRAPQEGNGSTDNYQYVEFAESGTGLSPLSLYDTTGDRTVDRVYAGDLNGRMWVGIGGNQGWGSAYRTGQTPLPLFTSPSVGSPAERQSITAAPMIIRNAGQKPAGGAPDTYVLFGTGRYMGVNDLSDNRQQAFYAVRDTGSSQVTVSQLAQRRLVNYPNYQGLGVDALLSETSTGGAANDDRGWYVNLFESGERIYLTPQVRGRYIFAVSIIPSSNPCISGGESRIMVFGLDGLTPDRPVLTALDVPVTSYKKIDGIANPFAFLGNFMFTPTSGGGDPDIEGIDVGDVLDGLGRQGWQELIEN